MAKNDDWKNLEVDCLIDPAQIEEIRIDDAPISARSDRSARSSAHSDSSLGKRPDRQEESDEELVSVDEEDENSDASSTASSRSSSSTSSSSSRRHKKRRVERPEDRMTPEEIKKKKRMLLYALYKYKTKNSINLGCEFSEANSLTELEDAVHLCNSDMKLNASVNVSKNAMIALASAIEWANNKWDPFDVYLDGWSDYLNENSSQYDEVLEELWLKYENRFTLEPEYRLMMMFTCGALTYSKLCRPRDSQRQIEEPQQPKPPAWPPSPRMQPPASMPTPMSVPMSAPPMLAPAPPRQQPIFQPPVPPKQPEMKGPADLSELLGEPSNSVKRGRKSTGTQLVI